MGNKRMRACNLIQMNKSKTSPREGDVFALQPKEGIYYFGKVIKVNLKSKDSFINGMSLIYIYECFSDNKSLPAGELDEKEFLIAPIIVNNQPWIKGYFETICNLEVTENEKKKEVIFWDVLKEEFVDINGNVANRKTQLFSIYGLGSYGIVGKEVQKAIEHNKFFNE